MEDQTIEAHDVVQVEKSLDVDNPKIVYKKFEAAREGSWIDEHGRKWYPYIPQGERVQQVLLVMQACIDAGVPVVLIGYPGTGKTSLIEALSMALERNMHYISIADMSVEDIAGVMHTMTDSKGRLITKYAMPWWQLNILDDEDDAHAGRGNAGVLVVDELNATSISTQRAFLPILATRIFPSGEHFSNKTAIIGAVNPDNQSGGEELSDAMDNRICWIPFAPEYNDVSDGFVKRWKSKKPMPVPVIKKSCQAIEQSEVRLAEIVNEYVKTHLSGEYTVLKNPDENPASVGVVPGDKNDEFRYDQTFASQRTWDALIRIIARLDYENGIDKMASLLELVIYGTIGRSVGVNFMKYLKNALEKGMGLTDLLERMPDGDKPDRIPWNSLSSNQIIGVWDDMEKYCLKAKPNDDNVKKIYDLVIMIYQNRGDLFESNVFQNKLYKNEIFAKIPWYDVNENGVKTLVTDETERRRRTREYRTKLKKLTIEDYSRR